MPNLAVTKQILLTWPIYSLSDVLAYILFGHIFFWSVSTALCKTFSRNVTIFPQIKLPVLHTEGKRPHAQPKFLWWQGQSSLAQRRAISTHCLDFKLKRSFSSSACLFLTLSCLLLLQVKNSQHLNSDVLR